MNVPAVDVSTTQPPLDVGSDGPPVAWKMGFDGTGVTNGLPGTIWAFGLNECCDRILHQSRILLEAKRSRPLHLTIVGLSRGGCGALLFAKRCAELGKEALSRIRLNLLVYDPVPGNLINTLRFCDLFGLTVAGSTLDVRSAPIARMLAIYPHEPLPDLAFHAPVLPRCPAHCDLEVDATLGCHQGAVYPPEYVRPTGPVHDACVLSHNRLLSFLAECGVRVNDPAAPGGPGEARLRAQCLAICESALRTPAPSTRAAHAYHQSGMIIRHAATSGRRQLLNKHHRKLLEHLTPEDPRLKSPKEAGDELPLLLEVWQP